MKIYITGDLHGASELIRFKTNHIKFKKDDVILQLGDAEIIWSFNQKDISEENKWLNWYEKNIPATLICIFGNHENFDRIIVEFKLERIYDVYCKKVRKNIFFIQNGSVLTINNKTFLSLGGASSIDKINRKKYIDWWPQEQMSSMKHYETLNYLKDRYKNKIDYVLSHTAPESIIKEHFKLLPDCVDNTSKFLEEIKNTIEFKKWYFGHFHEDKKIDDKFTCLYKTIEELN